VGDDTPASFDQLWRSGVLPGLVVTLTKGAGCHPDSLAALGTLLRQLLPPPGQLPWHAASPERQQFALLVLAGAGMHASSPALASTRYSSGSQVHVILAAALQLAQPPLRQLLETAAPALVVDADALLASSSEGGCPVHAGNSFGSPALRQAVDLLTALAWQLDALALGLALPGCYNPACTSLVGASEAAMKLKRCTACKTARWAGWGRRASNQLGCSKRWLRLAGLAAPCDRGLTPPPCTQVLRRRLRQGALEAPQGGVQGGGRRQGGCAAAEGAGVRAAAAAEQAGQQQQVAVLGRCGWGQLLGRVGSSGSADPVVVHRM